MAEAEKSAWLEGAMARWETSLLRLCYAYLNDASLAEDAVQETFLKAWKSYDRFRRAADEKTWLTRIAINTCKDTMKSAYFRHIDRSASLDHLPEGSAPFTLEDHTVTKAVLRLPSRYREVVLLRWLQGLSGDETARILRVPRFTVYHRLTKAQQLLKQELEEWYHAD